jgi:hypothetical protein
MTQGMDRLRTGVELYDEQDPEKLFLWHARTYRTPYGRQRAAQTIALLKQAHSTDGAGLLYKCLAVFEWSGLNRRMPLSIAGWSIGVLARKAC